MLDSRGGYSRIRARARQPLCIGKVKATNSDMQATI